MRLGCQGSFRCMCSFTMGHTWPTEYLLWDVLCRAVLPVSQGQEAHVLRPSLKLAVFQPVSAD